MKEDILEQVIAEYLNVLGYFTLANVKFKPKLGCAGHDPQQDSVSSDIDIIGYSPGRSGPARVVAVSCKSWQAGFWPQWELDYIRKDRSYAGRKRWKSFRELVNDKWARAFKQRIRELTGVSVFEYWTACLFTGDEDEKVLWTENMEFKRRLTPHLRLITLHDMFIEISKRLTTTPAGSEVGRLIQVMKAARIEIRA